MMKHVTVIALWNLMIYYKIEFNLLLIREKMRGFRESEIKSEKIILILFKLYK
jgi:hypothetical protein